jgi:hypothetical protein
MQQDFDGYIVYRLTKSQESFEDARLLADNERWNAAVNRLYYTYFYAVSALLLSRQIEAYTHSGCKTQFGLHFIKTGIIETPQGRLYADLMDWRQKSDYGDMFEFDKETVGPVFQKVELFLEIIKKRLTTKIFQDKLQRTIGRGLQIINHHASCFFIYCTRLRWAKALISKSPKIKPPMWAA